MTVVLSATGLLAHPLFNGELISRAEDLLPAYDYVVVGAGASGLTVANRLSENQSTQLQSRDVASEWLTQLRNRCPSVDYRGWSIVRK